jgi:hypothetical protein
MDYRCGESAQPVQSQMSKVESDVLAAMVKWCEEVPAVSTALDKKNKALSEIEDLHDEKRI